MLLEQSFPFALRGSADERKLVDHEITEISTNDMFRDYYIDVFSIYIDVLSKFKGTSTTEVS